MTTCPGLNPPLSVIWDWLQLPMRPSNNKNMSSICLPGTQDLSNSFTCQPSFHPSFLSNTVWLNNHNHHPPYLLSIFNLWAVKRKKNKAEAAGQELGQLAGLHWVLDSGDKSLAPGKQSPSDFTERTTMYMPCSSILFGQSILFMFKRIHRLMRSVNASHACLCTNVVKHCLDELRKVVFMFPPPVVSCVGVVEVHRPTVSYGRSKKQRSEITTHPDYEISSCYYFLKSIIPKNKKITN